MTPQQAELELVLMSAEAGEVHSSDIYAWLRESGLPPEVAIRVRDLVEITRKVGDTVINIGKLLMIKIVEFVRAHPNLVLGIAVGAAISALVGAIPLLGSLLAPLAAAIGMSIGALVGHRMDRHDKGNNQTPASLAGLTQDVIEIAAVFFQFFMDVMRAAFNPEIAEAK